jgi:hypothetical protein
MALPAGFEVIKSPFDIEKESEKLPKGFTSIENPFKLPERVVKEPPSFSDRFSDRFSEILKSGIGFDEPASPQEIAALQKPKEGIASLRPEQPSTATVNDKGQITGMTGEEYLSSVAKRKEQTPDRSVSDYAVDSGVTFLKATIGVPEFIIGILDIPTLGRVGKLLQDNGFNPKEAKAILDTYLSEGQQVANRKVKETKGFFPTIGAALENPSVIATSVAESLPSMFGGALIARGLLKAAPTLSPYLAGALGEGVVGAGSAAEQMRQESKDQLLNVKQALSAVGSGIGTAIFGAVGGRLAKKLGFDDIDTLLVSGSTQGGSKSVKDFAKKALFSGVSEGLFEEMPQSAQEQMWMNYATDKPFLQGVPEAAAMGAITGAAMGVGSTALARRRSSTQQELAPSDRVEPYLDQQPAGIAALAPTASTEPIAAKAPSTPPAGIAALVPPAAPVVTSEEGEAQDIASMMREVNKALGIPETTLPPVKVETPARDGVVPAKPDAGVTATEEVSQSAAIEEFKQKSDALVAEMKRVRDANDLLILEPGSPDFDAVLEEKMKLHDAHQVASDQLQALTITPSTTPTETTVKETSVGIPKTTLPPVKVEEPKAGITPPFVVGDKTGSGRVTVLKDVNGVQVPFYISTGKGGKANVETGKWYPFFGVGPDGWFNKGTEKDINNFYGSPELKAAADELNNTVGDIRQQMGKLPSSKELGVNVNTDMRPTAFGESNTILNIRDTLNKIRSQKTEGKPSATEAPQTQQTTPQGQQAPAAPVKPPAASKTAPVTGPESRAPQVPDLKKYTPTEAKDQWNSAGQGKRSAVISRLQNRKLEKEIIGKSWEDLTPEQRKATKSALDEDFFTPSSYTNTKGEQVRTGPAVMPAGAAPVVAPSAPVVTPAITPTTAEETAKVDKAKEDLIAALGDLGEILTKNTRMNMMPEEEQKLMPVLTRLMDAAFRMGYYKFKQAVKFILNTVRETFGKEAASKITLDHLQGAYIGMAGKYQGASSKKEVVSIESLEEAEAEEAVQADLSTPDGKFSIAQKIADIFNSGKGFNNIIEARKAIEEMTGQKIVAGTEAAKNADEAIEVGVVLSSRNIVEQGRKDGLNSGQIYDKLVDLYNRQPNLAVRSSTSVADQAYSTPAPLAYVASELAGIDNKTSVHEPAAGNGMLTIGANPKNVTANELNANRFQMLQRILEGGTVTEGNALQSEEENSSFDVVIENPPFGKAGDISNIDHDIALRSLVTMKDDGRAVLILGGVQATTEDGRREGYRANAKRNFYYELYNLYNVVDHFTVGGNLYGKQGTTYPVDVIVIDGLGKSKRDLPASDLPQVFTSYEQLKEKLNDRMVPRGDVSPTGVDGGVSTEGGAKPGAVDRGTERPSDVAGTKGGKPSGVSERGVSEAGPATGGQPKPTGERAGEKQLKPTDTSERDVNKGTVPSGSEQGKPTSERGAQGNKPGGVGGVSAVSGERIESGLKERAGQEEETSSQITYTPKSSAIAVGTLAPRAMAQAIQDSIDRIESQVGNVDEFVAEALEMDPETLRENFSAEQIDALVLAIRNAQEGKGFIIGDQTGVGKGRVVAAMIKYALINDKIPIFVTEKPNLYSDMIRDLDDIGMTDELGIDTANTKILMTNAGKTVPYKLVRKVNGEPTEVKLNLKAPKSSVDKLDELLETMQENESLGDFKVIFTTYNQLQTVRGKTTTRQRFIKQFGAGNYMIFDESHNAGGAGETQARTKEQQQKQKEGKGLAQGRAAFVRDLVQNAYGTFFSSATYAKRPDVMDLYSSTDMKLAVDKLSDLADAIKNGGIPMQQTVATMLAKVGQYIRRERTFAGVSYDTVETKVNKDTAENMASTMSQILAFSRVKETVIKELQKEFDKEGKKAGIESGEKTQVQSVNFGAGMHTLIDQMLLSLKAQDSVRHAVERLKAGEKVVMTVANTMGSFLDDYSEEMGIRVGDPIDLSFADLYQKYLEKQRNIKIKHPGGRVEEYRLTDQDLGAYLTEEFNTIRSFINDAGFGDAPISPIDYIHNELNKVKIKDASGNERNIKTGEITGRTTTINNSSGTPILTSRNPTIKNRVDTVDNFNDGKIDVIILNQAGSTGLSLHASKRFKDQSKRHMIIVQPEKNIDTHMQMLGRVHRTGQIMPPAYSQMMADIPAEMRPAAVLLKKMASLNANTTGSRKSAVSAEGTVDFMNDYGGQVAQEYLRDNQEVYEALGGNKVIELMDDPTEAEEKDIRKLTGYIPILPIKQQEEIYKDLIERYNELVTREDSMGTNKLESKASDLDAETISSEPITEDKGVQSDFGKPAYMERVDVKRTVKPFSKEEVRDQVNESRGGKTSSEFGKDLLKDLNDRVRPYIDERIKNMIGDDDVKADTINSQISAQASHVRSVIEAFPIGSGISVQNSTGVFVYGAITNIINNRKTKNPVAGSDWKMQIALANGDAKTITLSFSQVGSSYTLKREQEVNYLNPETLKGEYIPLVDLFDKGATVRREKRWMVTGNILAGYAAVNNMGQILSYTKKDGTTGQGILMPRTFDFEKSKKDAPVKLKSANDVVNFFENFGNGTVSTEDSNLRIVKRGNHYDFFTESSKKLGGVYFLDRGLTSVVGDFYKTGSVMKATYVSLGDVERAVQYLLKDKGVTLVAANNKEEARKLFAPKPFTPGLENINQGPISQRLNLDENRFMDRDELIRRYQSVRQKRAGVLAKFAKGAAGLNEQEAINELNETAENLSNLIKANKPARRSAKNFFADATKAWDAGEISDDVYSAIKTMYERHPNVLEGLKFSVRMNADNPNAAGEFFSLARIVRLYKGTVGTEDPVTIRHEITHSLEQMMSAEAAADVIMDWSDKLGKAIKNEKSPKAQAYFRAVLEFFESPSEESYKRAMSLLPSYDYYQYINPSEYWAVNAEKLMARKLGSGWDRFVLSVKGMFEAFKDMFGFDNQYAVHKAFSQIMSGKMERTTKSVLNDYVLQESFALMNQNVRRNYKGGPAPLATWQSASESKIDNLIYKYQDKHVDTKRVVEAIKNEIGRIEDAWDPYLQEELFHGKTAKQTTDFLKDELRPLLEDMDKRKISLQDFEEYLHNRHAKIRNEHIAARNPEMPDGGSGLFNAEVDKYMAALDQNPDLKKNYEELADKIDGIVKGTQDILVSSGLEKPETIAAWREKLPFYVPYNRDPNELDYVNATSGMGQGFAVSGKFSKAATGSLKTVVDIVGNIALQRERAIVRSEKARVGRAVYALAITNPNPNFWMPINPDAIKNKKKFYAEMVAMNMSPADAQNIIQEPKVASIDSTTGLVRYSVNPALRRSDNVLPVIINGEERFVFFNAGDPNAKRMVESLKNLDANQMDENVQGIAEITRFIAAASTQYNPVFGAFNFTRDVQSAAINLSSTPIADRKLQVTKDSMVAVRAIYRDLRGKGATTPEMKKWIDLFEQFQQAGGQTGFREQFSRGKGKETIVARELARLDRNNAKKVAYAVFDWLSDYNDAMENAVRLAAFKAGLDQGLTVDRAASVAKNITVNFNRKGANTPTIGALYAFFNASVQGTARLIETLFTKDKNGKMSLSPAGKKIIAGGMFLGVMQTALLAMAGFGPDDPPEWIKSKNLVIPTFGVLGEGKYLLVPMPLGFNIFPNVGRIVSEYMMVQSGGMKGKRDLKKTIAYLSAAILGSVNPLGSSTFAQTISPTVLDPITGAFFENKDAFGRPVYKEDQALAPTPGYKRSRDSANFMFQGLAYGLNYITGGGEKGIGAFSPTADQLSYIAGQYTGGVGKLAVQTAEYAKAKVIGEELQPYQVPIAGKLYGDINTPAATSGKFYENIKEMSQHESIIKEMKGKGVSEYYKENPEARLWQRANYIENQIAKIKKERKALKERDAPDAQLKRKDEQIKLMMESFNKEVTKRQ